MSSGAEMNSESKYLLQPVEQKRSFYFLQTRKGSNSKDKEVEMEPRGSESRNSESRGSWMYPLPDWFSQRSSTATESDAKPRKLPVKVEPKVFFANERTFLSWLNMSITLASISLAILAFADSNEWSQVYGICLMPVAIAFCVYALWMFIKRASMIRRKDPGPYEDRVGPVVLASMLAIAVVVNFIVKLYQLAQ